MSAGIEINITIWDLQPARIHRIEQHLADALRDLQIKGNINSMSEPPLLSRMDMLHRIPALEIDGSLWTLSADREMSYELCFSLLARLKEQNQRNG